MEKNISILDENGILEYVKVDINKCGCVNNNMKICNDKNSIKCIECNEIIGYIIKRNFQGEMNIALTR